MNKKAFLVAEREFMEHLRTKTFWLGIFFFPVLITLSIVIPIWMEENKEARTYAVIDRSGWLLAEVEERAAMPDLAKVFHTALESYRDNDESFSEMPEALRQTAERLVKAIESVEGQALPGVDPDRPLEDQVIDGFATLLTGLSGPEGEKFRQFMPEEAINNLMALRDSVRDWWSELPPEEAAKYGARAKSRYVRIDPETDDIEALNKKITDQELFGYFVIGEDPVGGETELKYVSANLTDTDLLEWFQRLATDSVRERRLEAKEIDKSVAAWVQAPLRFESRMISRAGEEEEVETQDKLRQWAPVAFVYLLWFAVFMNAQMLLTNTVEEKSNRILEVLLSSVSPVELMSGKIAGIAAVGLTMLITWIASFLLAVKYVPKMMGADAPVNLSAIAGDPLYLGSFLVYFLLGYLFFAALLVGIGSVCNSLKEAQNLQQPVVLILIVPIMAMVPIAEDPNSTLAKVMSYIPPFTPFVMMNRAGAPPTTMEYVATTILLVASTAFMLWAAAKVFRIGVLMTGKPPKVSEIVRWIRAPVGMVPERSNE